MPYGGPNDKPVPDHVPASKRAQWAAVWNKTHAECVEKGEDDCEEYAFRVANGAMQEGESQGDMGQDTINEAAMLFQKDVYYQPESSRSDTTCGNCRWFSDQPNTMPCHLVVNSPTTIQRGGYCEKWQPMPDGSTVNAWVNDVSPNNPNRRDQAEQGEYAEAVQITGPAKTQVFTESIELVLAEADTQKRTVPVVLIRPGWSKNGRYYPPAVLAKAVPLFEGTKAYANHPTPDDIKRGVSRSVLEITGRYKDVQIGPQGELRATRHIFGAAGEAIWPLILEGIQSGDPVIGLSINAAGKGAPGKAPDGKTGIIVEDIFYANSVDDVDNPAAGGGFEPLVAGADELTAVLIKAMSLEELLVFREDVVARSKVERDTTALQDARDERTRAQQGWRAETQRADDLQEGVNRLQEQITTLQANVSTLQGELDKSKDLLALEKVLYKAHLLPEWEADIRQQLEKAKPDEWMNIVERERRKAQSVIPQARVPIDGAPRQEQKSQPIREAAQPLPYRDETADQYATRMTHLGL